VFQTLGLFVFHLHVPLWDSL